MAASVAISNLQGLNAGDGKTINASWSVPDINQVKYFIVEYWDRNKYQWLPYDGFHGLVSAKPGVDSAPPTNLNFATNFTNCSVSFRVAAASQSLTMSAWSTTSVQVKSFITTTDSTGTVTGNVSINNGGISGGTSTNGWSLNANGSVYLNSLFPSSTTTNTVQLTGSMVISAQLETQSFVADQTCVWGSYGQRTDLITDFDAAQPSGFYGTSHSMGASKQPDISTTDWLGINVKDIGNSSFNYYQIQLAGSIRDSNALYYRATMGVPNSPWHRVWHDGNAPFVYSGTNFTFGAPNLSGGQNPVNLILPNNCSFTLNSGSTMTINNGSTLNYNSDLVGSGDVLMGRWFPNYCTWDNNKMGAGNASIVNDNDTYKCLMIVGNNIGNGSTRQVGIWDNLTVNGTMTASKVYNAVYNDYAEYFLRDNEFEAGDIVCKNINGKGYIKSASAYNKLVVGVLSDRYAQCIGGDKNVTLEKQESKYAPIGLAGRINVKVYGDVEPGDLLVSSDIAGVAMAAKEYIPGTVIGKALEYHYGTTTDKIEMLILNM